ncbi:MAG: site-specific DNA-methyltransferase [Anaerolineae bacterium]|nr:site-specific DNA-methyltransferase [Anaerolineae bacterium]
MSENPYLNQILLGNTLEVMPKIPEKSVDLVFADPPYNLQLRQDLWRPNMTLVDGVDNEWDQFEGFKAYDEFTRNWLKAVRRIMNETATIWISGTYHNIFRVGTILQDLGFWILNTVTWYKPNAMPNFRGTRLKNDVEFVIWAKKSEKSRYTFNHHDMKQFNDGKQLGSWWEIPVCGGVERLKDDKGKKLHPTQKPEELLKRIILASSNVGDVVLDPFVGTGTTPAVAKHMHRHWIGIDSEATYIEAARARVEAVQPLVLSHPLLKTSSQHKPVRVPFQDLLKRHYLRAGQTLQLHGTEYTAQILHNGNLQTNGFTGSIHKLGAQLKNVPSCNGWKQWYYEDETTGETYPIDHLRQQIRQILEKENKQ